MWEELYICIIFIGVFTESCYVSTQSMVTVYFTSRLYLIFPLTEEHTNLLKE